MSERDGFFPGGRRAAVSLTFDDARLSQADVGLDLLAETGTRATFYVSLDSLAKRLSAWQRAVAAGHEIGNHTMTHPCTGNFPWSRRRAIEEMTLQQMEQQELLAANQAIRQLLNVTPKTFAYPCGQTYVGRGETLQSYIPLVARHFLAGRLFRTEITNDPDFCDLANLCAYESDNKSFAELKSWIDSAIEQGRWLVLAGHEIGDEGRQTTLCSALQQVCRYCAQRGEEIWIDTVENVASHLSRVRIQQKNEAKEPSCIA